MDIETFREYCLGKPAVSEGFPFDEDTLVFKVKGKIFALTSLSGDFTLNLKCDPEKALSLREEFNCIQPGYHMNKRHWNTITVDGSLSDRMLKELTDHSYELVAAGSSGKKTAKP